ncbi:MAG: transcription termination/antitermination protein NusA [Deltaproteobacteria bacterium]|nr:transcription termination/antitermination protein NusA [Deltaproteobacteria bacterium]
MKGLFELAASIAKEHDLSIDELLDVIKDAMKAAAQRKFGEDIPVEVVVDKEKGLFQLYVEKKVVSHPQSAGEISLSEAKNYKENARRGSKLKVLIDPKEMGRIAAATAENAVLKMFKEAERRSTFEEYEKKEGKIITGTVWSVDVHGNIIVDFKNTMGVLPQREQSPADKFIVGDIIRVYLLSVRREARGVKLILSRTHPGFVRELFVKEVPEVRDGGVEIKAVARGPGQRTKVAVYAKDSRIDPVGTCVGSRGVRITAVVKELGDEKIDVIKWSHNASVLIANSISPARALAVEIDEENRKALVVVTDEDFPIAIGKKGINARLAAKLTGYNIDIVKSSEYNWKEEGEEEEEEIVKEFCQLKGIGEKVAETLYNAGYESVDDLKRAGKKALLNIKGLGKKRGNLIWEHITRGEET